MQANLEDVMENELVCAICSELMIQVLRLFSTILREYFQACENETQVYNLEMVKTCESSFKYVYTF